MRRAKCTTISFSVLLSSLALRTLVSSFSIGRRRRRLSIPLAGPLDSDRRQRKSWGQLRQLANYAFIGIAKSHRGTFHLTRNSRRSFFGDEYMLGDDSVHIKVDRSFNCSSNSSIFFQSEATSADRSEPSSTLLDLPRHVAFICDGNTRWTDKKALPKAMGHAEGANRVLILLKTLQERSQRWRIEKLKAQPFPKARAPKYYEKPKGVEICTFFAFSTENWKRPPSEISAIMKLIEKCAYQYRQQAVEEGNVRIKILGDLDDERIPETTRRELRLLESETSESTKKTRRRSECRNDTPNSMKTSHEYCEGRSYQKIDYGSDVLTVCLAINYGGRADILSAAGRLARSIASGEISPESINDESEISRRLSTSSLPDPDLIIRTGGERRLSNFLLWNAAYAELYFTEVLWPDFDEEALDEALIWYGHRKRRFGGR